jgi:hypothetical protein
MPTDLQFTNISAYSRDFEAFVQRDDRKQIAPRAQERLCGLANQAQLEQSTSPQGAHFHLNLTEASLVASLQSVAYCNVRSRSTHLHH